MEKKYNDIKKGKCHKLALTKALELSHDEKYVVKKLGSFPSVTLYSGTFGDKPSRDAANSM